MYVTGGGICKASLLVLFGGKEMTSQQCATTSVLTDQRTPGAAAVDLRTVLYSGFRIGF